MMFPNEYKISRTKPKELTLKQLNEIDKRRLYAMKCNSFEEIEEMKDKVLGIIDTKGLSNDNDKVSLDTATKILPFIMPQKKAIETTIIMKKIEDIIQESTEEVEFKEIKQENSESEKTEQKQALGSSRLNKLIPVDSKVQPLGNW